jgi:chaperonin GroES
MKVIPLMDRVLVKRLESLEKTAGGLYIPETAKEKPAQGVVISVGEGKLLDDGTRVPMIVAEGNTVMFGKYAGTEIKLAGEEHMILRESDILGIVED